MRKRERDGTGFRLESDIEQRTNLQKVLEEPILDNRVEFSLGELLGIAGWGFHDILVDLVKRKRSYWDRGRNRD